MHLSVVRIEDKRLAIVVAHLEASTEKYDVRVSEYARISAGAGFPSLPNLVLKSHEYAFIIVMFS